MEELYFWGMQINYITSMAQLGLLTNSYIFTNFLAKQNNIIYQNLTG